MHKNTNLLAEAVSALRRYREAFDLHSVTVNVDASSVTISHAGGCLETTTTTLYTTLDSSRFDLLGRLSVNDRRAVDYTRLIHFVKGISDHNCGCGPRSASFGTHDPTAGITTWRCNECFWKSYPDAKLEEWPESERAE